MGQSTQNVLMEKEGPLLEAEKRKRKETLGIQEIPWGVHRSGAADMSSGWTEELVGNEVSQSKN